MGIDKFLDRLKSGDEDFERQIEDLQQQETAEIRNQINDAIGESLSELENEWKRAFETYRQRDQERFLEAVKNIKRKVVDEISDELEDVTEREHREIEQQISTRLEAFRQGRTGWSLGHPLHRASGNRSADLSHRHDRVS